ncbi:hypothetical protein Sm713_21910 [Streptomyces sp. TS71-3]|nr:hypothetical protein Sm713_21910 [Streptomyces sp. TS71-3]
MSVPVPVMAVMATTLATVLLKCKGALTGAGDRVSNRRRAGGRVRAGLCLPVGGDQLPAGGRTTTGTAPLGR